MSVDVRPAFEPASARRPSTPPDIKLQYGLPTPPPSERSWSKDSTSSVGDATVLLNDRTHEPHPSAITPTKLQRDAPKPLDLEASHGSGFAQSRSGKSSRPLDITVQPPSASSVSSMPGDGPKLSPRCLPEINTDGVDRVSHAQPHGAAYSIADAPEHWTQDPATAQRRHSYLPMDTPVVDNQSAAAWPFHNGLGAHPSPLFPKSPSLIHPSYGIPASMQQLSPDQPDEDVFRNGRSSSRSSPQSDPESGHFIGIAPHSGSAAPRPFYQPAEPAYAAGAPPTPLRRQLDSATAWIIYYFFANLALTLYNKFVLVSFPYPWSLTGVHTLCGAVGARVLLSRGAFTPSRLSRRENLVLIAFSSLYTINIAVSNLSLNLVTVPFHQVVRAMTPLFTIAISFVLLNKRHSRRTFLALVPVVMGVGFATYGDYYFTTWGLFLTLLGTMLAAMKTVTTNIIMVGRLKLHPLDLLLRMSPLAFVQCIVCAWYTGELDRVRTYGATQMTSGRATGLLMNGAIAFLLNIVSFSANKKTSALTMTVAANVKQVLTILLAVFIFKLHVTPTNLLGIVLTLSGGAAYASVELSEKRRKSNAALSLSSISTHGPGPLVMEKSSPVPDIHETTFRPLKA